MTELVEAAGRAEAFRLHPLGFFYLHHEIAQGVSRRVHVWLETSVAPRANDRHLHSYDIESIVVAGALFSELYQFNQHAGGTVFESVVSYGMDESVGRPTGKRGVLRRIVSFETSAGTSYWLKAGVIHRVAASVLPCVTMVTTSERGIPVFVYGPAEEKQPFVRRLATYSESCGIATVLEKAIQR